MNIFTRIMLSILKRVNPKPLRPEPVRRECYSCRKTIEDWPDVRSGAVMWEGKPYCGYFCIPSVARVHRVEVEREQLHREGEALKRAREAGV